MSLSIKGSNSAAGTTVTLPTHAIGDLIVIYAYRDGSTTVPTKPTASGTVPAWVDIDAATGANSNSLRCAYFKATATNHTSGTWTNATGMAAIVISGQHTSPIGGHTQSGSTGNGTATAPAITQSVTDGSSLLLYFYGHRSVTAWSTAPTGYTRQTSTATEVCLNTKNDSTSDGSQAQSCTTTNSGYRGQTIEILAAAAPIVNGAAVLNIVTSMNSDGSKLIGETINLFAAPSSSFVCSNMLSGSLPLGNAFAISVDSTVLKQVGASADLSFNFTITGSANLIQNGQVSLSEEVTTDFNCTVTTKRKIWVFFVR